MLTQGPQIGIIPPSDDARLLALYAGNRDAALRDRLVERFMPLARKLALRYSYTNEPLDDLVQVACVGLLKALERFQPERGHKFTSFATPTILGELKRHFRDKGWAIHVPRDLQERALAVSRHTERLAGQLGRNPTLTELAEAMNCRVDDVLEGTLALRSYDTASLDAPVTAEDHEAASLGETLPSHDSGFDLAETRDQMAERWRSLSDLERKVVELRVVHDLTQREIGRRIGYSQMHVSRLLRRSLQRLEVAPGVGSDGEADERSPRDVHPPAAPDRARTEPMARLRVPTVHSGR